MIFSMLRPNTEVVLQALADILQCDVSDLSESSAIGTVPLWDSLAHIEILSYLEEKFLIEIDEESILYYSTLPKILELTQT